MAKAIIMRANLFIIHICYILLHIYLSCRGENRLMLLVRLFTTFKKIAHNRNMFYCPTKWQLLKPFKFFVLDHTSGCNLSVDMMKTIVIM